MFARLAVLSALSFAVFAAADHTGTGSCSTGPVQCCNSMESVRPPTCVSDSASYLRRQRPR